MADRIGRIDLNSAHHGWKCFTFNLIENPAETFAVGPGRISIIMLLLAKAQAGLPVRIRVYDDITMPVQQIIPKCCQCDGPNGTNTYFLTVIDVWGIP